jgi:hypothetical protein
VAPDGAIESEQRVQLSRRVVDSSHEGARVLGAAYWPEVEACARRLVRARSHDDGVELRALGVVLLAFGTAEPRLSPHEVACTYPIRGGRLARRAAGAITLAQSTGDPPELRSTITGFLPTLAARPGAPRWTGALYSQVQQRIHLAVSRRYFRRLLAESAS